MAEDYIDVSPHVSKEAALALQTATEDYLIELLSDAVQAAVSRKSQTITPQDIQLVRRVRKERA